MPTYLAPGIYVEEKSSGNKPIGGVSTSVAAFIGVARKGPVGKATLVTSFGDFVKRFGGPIRIIPNQQEIYLYYAVRHFFAHGGTRCYVVRVAGTAKEAASTDLGHLAVEAIDPGKWGEAISVQLTPTSRYSLPLEADTTPGASTLQVAQNTDIRVGSLLWVVDEAVGIVDSIDDTSLTFGQIDHLNNPTEGTPTPFTIPERARAYTPDLLLETRVGSAVDVTPEAEATVTLATVTGAGGTDLRPGDVVNFALDEWVGAVTKVGQAVVVNEGKEETVMEVEVAPTISESFAADVSRVYERGFSLTVFENGEAVETHESLSLVETDLVNHVGVRLPSEAGRSFYVTANGSATTLVEYANAPLAGGNDGLPSLATGDALDTIFIGDEVEGTGLHALDKVKDASILCVTNPSQGTTMAAISYCDRRKDLFLVVDPPRTRTAVADPSTGVTDYVAEQLNATSYAAIYFPWIRVADPFSSGELVSVPPSGAIAGIYARSDGKRGVHKAPAGIDVGRLDVASGTAIVLSKADNDTLHDKQVNAIRNLPEGIVVWGARTLSADSEWIYVNVRRLFIFLEQSIERGTQWAAFEPNDASLWKKLRRNISAFLKIQWLEGKLVGDVAEQAFYVKCDAETNPPEIVDAGMVVTEIGVAPSKPAEFVVFRIQQIAGGGSGS